MSSSGIAIGGRCVVLAGCLAACSGAQTEEARRAEARGSPAVRAEAPGSGERAAAEPAVDPCDWERGGQLGLPRCPSTGDPLPEPPVTHPACRDGEPGATRWLAMDPHTPLAITDPVRGIVPAGQPCCAPWARRGARYRSVDAFGQVAGVVAIDGGEGYDASACFELSLGTLSGRDAGLVYASDDGGWARPSSAEWRPEADARRAFESFVEAVTLLAVVDPEATRHFDRDDPLPPLADRTLFFQVEAEDARGRHGSTDRYAVAGGRLLLVAWLSPEGKWVLTHMENDLANLGHGPVLAYRPLAVFDMDGDRAPEVIYHWNEGPGWAQVVLRRREAHGSWCAVAESVGGSTA